MDDKHLIEILSGRHFSMAERFERGIWPHPPLRLGEVVRCLAGVLREREWFPYEFVPAGPGGAVADITSVERCADGTFVVHIQRSGPTPATVGALGARPFTSAEGAAQFFLSAEFNLPGDLDGWKVVR